MAKNRLEISRTAERQLKKLRRNDQERVVKAIIQLADDPLPKGSRKLSGYDDVFRVRAGPRILYSVSGKKLIIILLKSGGHKESHRLTRRSSTPRPTGRRRQASGRYT